MADFLIQATLSNLLISTILALFAWFVQRRVCSPSLVNLLWAIVLIKMVTPPLFSFPVVEVASLSSSIKPTSELQPRSMPEVVVKSDFTLSMQTESPTDGTGSQTTSAGMWSRTPSFAIFAWILVSAIVFVVSAFRIVRFHLLLKANSRAHPGLSSGICSDVAKQLGIRRCPNVVVSSANIAPFVWWMAGRSIIVVSEQATRQLNQEDLRFVIAHEMAHVKRRDHWFRWLEWFSVVALWWNPIMWWARTQLRMSEEVACDDLVLETTHSDVHRYANSLLNMAELLTSPAVRPPVVASAINSGGHLEKRLTMIIADKTLKVPTWLRAVICAVAICVFPIGLVYAQDFEAVERRLGGAVEAGELSLEQANIMLEALKRSASFGHSDDRDMDARKRRYMALARKIEDVAKSGKLSKEDAEKKLIAIRKEIFSDEKDGWSDKRDDRDMEARKRRYMAFAKEIEDAVESGKLSKGDAEKKLIAMRHEMFEDKSSGEDRELEARKKRYEQVTERIKAAIERGDISAEEGEKKLIGLRKEMFSDEKEGWSDKRDDRDMEAMRTPPTMSQSHGWSDKRDDRDMEARKRRYMAFAKDIKDAVESGKLSEQEAEKKLIAVRREMFEDKSSVEDEDRELEARKKRYEQVTERIKAAVEKGDMTAEEGEKKLTELRKEIFGGRD